MRLWIRIIHAHLYVKGPKIDRENANQRTWSLHGHTVRERVLAEIQSWEEITKSGQIPSVSSGFVKSFLTGKGIGYKKRFGVLTRPRIVSGLIT